MNAGNFDYCQRKIDKEFALAKKINDFRFLSDAQVILAKIYLQSVPQIALDILVALEQYDPNPNPYLEVKAKALAKMDKNTQALSLMIEAKAAYNEAWKPENQALLEELK